MHHPLTVPILAALCWFLPSSPAHSQTIYRCGSSYSQSPCPGATSLDVTDTRTPTQKAEADAATAAAARTAAVLEKDRLARERSVPSRKPEMAHTHRTDADTDAPSKKGSRKTRPPAPYFVATAPADKAKAKTPTPKEKAGSSTVTAAP